MRTQAHYAFARAGLRRSRPARDWYANFEAYLMYGHVTPAEWKEAAQWEWQLYNLPRTGPQNG
ncbi:hypothetical protein DB31_7976 [Hyalangium minutum]|uniref:Uncharacterized protein n=1 Tax=Hyalangium minutum TaxID=394096 RepID=A0A085WM26_9BACT|nr:hypothetical protein DB31_7976 [Hyalangium minutum]